jgi:hypothetical protein
MVTAWWQIILTAVHRRMVVIWIVTNVESLIGAVRQTVNWFKCSDESSCTEDKECDTVISCPSDYDGSGIVGCQNSDDEVCFATWYSNGKCEQAPSFY